VPAKMDHWLGRYVAFDAIQMKFENEYFQRDNVYSLV
jgi:hypothetical protein